MDFERNLAAVKHRRAESRIEHSLSSQYEDSHTPTNNKSKSYGDLNHEGTERRSAANLTTTASKR
jgi:hypothetical protein